MSTCYRVRRLLAVYEPFATTPGAYAFAVVLGLLFGSFANVCIYRWPPTDEHPKGRSVIAPGSHCFACKAPIRWYDNVPLLSYLWLRGRCRNCRAEFSARYLLVEALTGMLFGAAWWFAIRGHALTEPFDARLIRFAISAAFLFVLVVITFIDLDFMLILDKVTLPSIPVFYGLGLLLPERRWFDGFIGAAVGYGLPWLVGTIYRLVTKREGLGLGDSKLLAVIGALLGWPGVLTALFGGSMVGSVVGLATILAGGRLHAAPDDADESDGTPADEAASSDPPSLMRAALPFGPFLAIGAVFYLFAADWIRFKLIMLGT